jgi:uncharacterized protein (DUF1810 family)
MKENGIKNTKESNQAKQRNLLRFIHAQDFGGIYDNTSTYSQALEEINNRYKKTHWIWYVFPQMKGLGKSEISEFYGINGREEAYAYMQDLILSKRLIEATEAVLNNEHSAYNIFGQDIIKFRSCMLLFATISDHPVFKQVIKKYHW